MDAHPTPILQAGRRLAGISKLGGVRGLCRGRFGSWNGLGSGILLKPLVCSSSAQSRAAATEGTVRLIRDGYLGGQEDKHGQQIYRVAEGRL